MSPNASDHTAKNGRRRTVSRTTAAFLVVGACAGLGAGLAGATGGYLWAAVAVAGLAGHYLAARAGGMRAYVLIAWGALVLLTGTLVAIAVVGGSDHRGALIGVSVIAGAMTLGLTCLVVALERRLCSDGPASDA